MKPMSRPGFLGLVVVCAVFVIQMAIYSVHQPMISSGGGRGDDGLYYAAVAEQLLEGRPVVSAAPFVHRLGAPWLAATLSRLTGFTVDESFQIINSALAFLLLALMYLAALKFMSPPFAVLATALFSLPWWSYTRLVWFYPILVDLPWLVLTLVGLWLVAMWPRGRSASPSRIFSFAFICFSATLSRETGLILPLMFFLASYRVISILLLEGSAKDSTDHHLRYSAGDLQHVVALSCVFIVCSAAAFAITRLAVTNDGTFVVSGSPYDFEGAILESIRRNTIWHYGISVFLAFGGPLIALTLIYRSYLLKKAREMPAITIFVGCVLMLSLIGGVNTLRFLSWASPVVLIVLLHLGHMLWSTESDTPALLAMTTKALFVLSIVSYVMMIHPFDGFYDGYNAWVNWGGLQFTPLSRSVVINMLPAAIVSVLFYLVGRQTLVNRKVEPSLEDVKLPAFLD